jgi:hypothetical protein
VRIAVKRRDTGNVVKLMDALRESLNDVGKGRASQPELGTLRRDTKPFVCAGSVGTPGSNSRLLRV